MPGGPRSRAQARRDKIRVITSRDGEGAIAALNRGVDDQEVRTELQRANVLRELAATSRALGHEPGHCLRSDAESVCFCRRCDARICVPTGKRPVSDGEALSEPCPAPSCAPPATWSEGGRSPSRRKGPLSRIVPTSGFLQCRIRFLVADETGLKSWTESNARPVCRDKRTA